ncbi:MAG TPA: HU family DNA-binding protein [Chitinophagaceae bacterium]
MHSLITSYLLQSKECILPGIGMLQIIHTPASTDTTTSRILPPFEGIIFKREDYSKSPGLVKYIADKKHIEQSEAENLLNDFCKEWKEKINAGEKLSFKTVGSIQKNADGEIVFEKENTFNFLRPITIADAYHRTEKQATITEDPIVPEVFEEKEENTIVERSYWGLWALILLAIGAVMLFYHFKDHKLTGTYIGNQNHYAVDSATATHH